MNKDKIKRFDFAKKPKKPSVLMYAAKYIISWPDLKKRGAKLEKIRMEGIEDKPYLLLVTHSSMVDFNLMLKATHPYPINNVMTLEGFNTYTEPLMRSLGVIGKRKFIQDKNLIKNIKYCIEDLKTCFVLFPEARYSLDGTGSYIPPSVASLIKMLKVPVVTLQIHGNFVTCPQWNKINKKTYVEASMEQIITKEETAALSKEEIFSRIKEKFTYDDFTWQKEKKIVINHPKRAEGLHALLYKCPHCMKEGDMDSKGTQLWCNNCGKQWEMNELGELYAKGGETKFSHIPDWSRWEKECVYEEVKNGTYYFEDKVRIETLPNARRFYKQGNGRLVQTPEGTRIEVPNYYGDGAFEVVKKPLEMDGLHIEYDYLGRGDCVDISIANDSFWCYLSKRDAITKLSFATDAIYQLAVERRIMK